MSDRFLLADLKSPSDRFLSQFEHMSLRESLRRIWVGLHSPPESGYRKYARAELWHLVSWCCSWMVPLLVLFLTQVMWERSGRPDILPSFDLLTAEETPIALDPPPIIEQEPVLAADTDLLLPSGNDVPATSRLSPPAHALPSALPTLSPPVDLTRSPVNIPLPFTDAGLGRRRAMIAKTASAVADQAVIRALRWLKAAQAPDGSWQEPGPAMTGLALLCFLGHGEVPGMSEEFGHTVQAGIEWLIGAQKEDGRFAGSDGHEYSLPIAAYALCESFAMTSVPRVREAAEASIAVIVNGQNASGGWNYNCKPSTRDDTSYMGWCVQALKAARMAGIGGAQVEDSMRRAVAGMAANAHPEGGFGYTAPGQSGLTGVGVLSLQMLGAPGAPQTRKGLAWLARIPCDWSNPWGRRPLYYWYYITQARHIAGGEVWNAWDRQFAGELINSQVVEERVEGLPTGYWQAPAGLETQGLVYNTTLCTLMLEVYYRYLPTYGFRPEETATLLAAPETGIDLKISFPEA